MNIQVVPSQRIFRVVYGSPDRPLRLGDVAIPCYVIEDGRRVIVQGAVFSALKMSKGSLSKRGITRLASFISGKGLGQVIPESLARQILYPLRIAIPRFGGGGRGEQLAYGHEGTILQDLCNAILEADKQGLLRPNQRHIAQQAANLKEALGVSALSPLSMRRQVISRCARAMTS